MKQIYNILILFLILVNGFIVSSQNYQWSYRVKGWYDQQTRGVATDNSGAVYSTGLFVGDTDFESNSPLVNLFSYGTHDIFIQKFDLLGNQIWVKQIGGSGVNSGQSITVDSNGDVLISGYFSGTADFDPGVGIHNLTSSGGMDIFILKLDSNGGFLWAKSFTGSIGDDYARSVTTDNLNNVYLTGTYRGTIDFDPNTGVTNLTSNGGMDVFVLKLDNNGNFTWAVNYGSTLDDEGYSLKVDSAQNVYITGDFSDTVDFDPSIGVYSISVIGGKDAFIQKLDINGDFVWAMNIGSSVDDIGKSLAINSLNEVFITGEFRGTVDFAPSSSTYNMAAGFYSNVFILKLDPNGTFSWANNIGGNNHLHVFSIAIDTNENIYTAGDFLGTADLDPGVNTYNKTSFGDVDIYMNKMDSNGNLIWARAIGGVGSDIVRSIDLDDSGNCYIVGSFEQAVDFDPNAGTQYMASNGVWDGFILKLSAPCTTIYTNDVQIACGSYTWIDGNTYNSSNSTATDTLQNINGCDSIITLNLTINTPSSGTDVQIACGSYTWVDGNTYNSSNSTATYTFSGAAVNGCDSIVTLDLTINNSSAGTDTQIACNQYTWIDGNTYSSSNSTATDTLQNINGCDSIVTLDLTIINIISTTTTNGSTITADQSGVNYQWIDCSDSQPIPGAINQSYTPIINGDYSVIITQGICSETSDCVNISTVNLTEIDFGKNILIYPNPTSELLTIELSDFEDVRVSIIDLAGKVIYSNHLMNNKTLSISLKNFETGSYLLNVTKNGQTKVFKVVKM